MDAHEQRAMWGRVDVSQQSRERDCHLKFVCNKELLKLLGHLPEQIETRSEEKRQLICSLEIPLIMASPSGQGRFLCKQVQEGGVGWPRGGR